MPCPDRDQHVVAGTQSPGVPIELECQLAGEHVERLLERVDVAAEPAPGLEAADGQLGVRGAGRGTDDDCPAESGDRAVGRRRVRRE